MKTFYGIRVTEFALQIEGVVNEIKNVTREIGFEDFEEENLNELLKSHSKELDENHLFNIDSRRTYEEYD